MSASREKKQRQGGTPTDKGVTAQQKEAAVRRKTIQYTVIGVVVAILVVALLVWNSGFFQRRATAATIGGHNYTAGEVSYWYHNTNAFQMTMAYGSMLGYDSSIAPEDQTYTTDAETGEVTTYHDYFLQSALDQLTTFTALYDAAIADGYTRESVKDDVAASVDSFKESASSYGYTYDQFLIANYGKYITSGIYEDMLTLSAVANQYYTDHYDSLSYTDAEYDAYYQEHADELDTFEYSYLYFTPDMVETTDADGNDLGLTDEQVIEAEAENLAAAKAKADDAAAALRSGTEVSALIEQYEPSNSADHAVNTGSSFSSAVYGEWLADGGRHKGDVGMVENGATGYYVVVLHDRFLEDTPSVNVRHILVRAEQDEGADTPTDEQMAAAKAEAQSLFDQWNAGEATEDSFAALANEHSDDGGSNTNGGLYEEVLPGNFVTCFNDWLFNEGARSAGDTGLLENNGDGSYYGYHVVYYVGSNPNDFQWKHTVRDTLSSEATTEWLDSLEADYTVTEGSGMSYVGV